MKRGHRRGKRFAGCKSRLGVGPFALLPAAVDARGPNLRQRRRRLPRRAAPAGPSEPPSSRLTSPDPHEPHASRAQLTLLSEAADHHSSPLPRPARRPPRDGSSTTTAPVSPPPSAAHKYSSNPTAPSATGGGRGKGRPGRTPPPNARRRDQPRSPTGRPAGTLGSAVRQERVPARPMPPRPRVPPGAGASQRLRK